VILTEFWHLINCCVTFIIINTIVNINLVTKLTIWVSLTQSTGNKQTEKNRHE